MKGSPLILLFWEEAVAEVAACPPAAPVMSSPSCQPPCSSSCSYVCQMMRLKSKMRRSYQSHRYLRRMIRRHRCCCYPSSSLSRRLSSSQSPCHHLSEDGCATSPLIRKLTITNHRHRHHHPNHCGSITFGNAHACRHLKLPSGFAIPVLPPLFLLLILAFILRITLHSTKSRAITVISLLPFLA